MKPISIGQYTVTSRLGQGGMGTVFLGVDAALGEQVALKVTAHRDDGLPARALLHEIRAVAALDHPHIVRVFDFGLLEEAEARALGDAFEAGCPYMVMEYVAGTTLSAHTPAPWRTLRTIGLALLDALAHAHARGVLHRDIKPSNVLVGADGTTLRLSDFGLVSFATHAHPDKTDARRRSIAGTPAFMAPEQFEGRWRDYGPHTDLYGLGCLLYTLAAGAPPFGWSGSFHALRASHLGTNPPLLEPCGVVPEGFDALMDGLLDKDTGRRLSSAARARRVLLDIDADASFEHTVDSGRSSSSAPASLAGLSTASPSTVHSLELSTCLTSSVFPDTHSGGVAPRAHTDAAVTRPQSAALPLPTAWRALEELETDRYSEIHRYGLNLHALRALPLVGRLEERDALWGLLAEVASEGRLRSVCVHGVAGLGRSRLARWLVERARELDVAVPLTTSFHGADQDTTSALADTLSAHFELDGLDPVAARIRLEPTLAPGEAGAVGLDVAEIARWLTGQERFDATTALGLYARCVARMAQDTRVIVVWDDVHLAPALLEGWSRHHATLAHYPILALLTSTTALSAPTSLDIPLAPLDRRDHDVLIHRVLGLSGELGATIAARTAGNPHFALGWVDALVQTGQLTATPIGFRLAEGQTLELDPPEGLIDVWRSHTERVVGELGLAGEQLLGLAATLGHRVPLRWLEDAHRALTRGEARDVEAELARAVEIAERGGVITLDRDDRALRFTHVGLREALRDRRPADVARAHHSACADLFGDEASPNHLSAHERLGRHLAGAERWAEAIAPLANAVRHRHKVSLDRRGSLELLDLRERAMRKADVPPDDIRWGEGMFLRIWLLSERGENAKALDVAEATCEAAARHGWTWVRAEAMRASARIAALGGDLQGAAARLEQVIALCASAPMTEVPSSWHQSLEAQRQNIIADAQVLLSMCLRSTGEMDRAEALIDTALRSYDAIDDPVGAVMCWRLLAMFARHRGDLEAARERAAQATRLAHAPEARMELGACENMLGEIARAEGRFDEAEVHYRKAVSILDAGGETVGAAHLRANIGLVLHARGEHLKARNVLRGCLAIYRRHETLIMEGAAHACILPPLVAMGDLSAIEHHVERAERLLAETGLIEADVARSLQEAASRLSALEHPLAGRVQALADIQWGGLGERRKRSATAPGDEHTTEREREREER